MKILITGIAGFVGSTLAHTLLASREGLEIVGIDNFIRPGSETNRLALRAAGVALHHADLRNPSDLEPLPPVDFVVDAAANPSVLAGVDGRSSSRQLLEHNLWGTVNLLEYCKTHRAGLLLLSTSRVYGIEPLASLPVVEEAGAFAPDPSAPLPPGLSAEGVAESFSTGAPISLYGSSKLASEALALEYGHTFGFPVWVNRCGVLAGAGQFGRADQGIFSFWLHSLLRQRPLKYIGFGGTGLQTRDALHPTDLAPLLLKQMAATPTTELPSILNLGGGRAQAMSLAQLTRWGAERFGLTPTVEADLTPRPFDIPWMVMDSALAQRTWGWQPQTPLPAILEEIALHAESHPHWLELSAP